MTKKEVLSKVLKGEAISTEEERKVVNKIIKSLEVASKYPTPTQKKNKDIKAQIVTLLNDNQPHKSTEIARTLNLPSTQKATSLLKQLVDEGAVVKTSDKKGIYFSKTQVTV